MKTNPLIPHRSDSAPAREEGRAVRPDDAYAVTRKALERWENEGGKIPELSAGTTHDVLARARRF